MNVTQRLLTATTLAATFLTAGCASMGGAGLPDYNSTDAGTRTAANQTYVGPNGIRFYQDGTPVAVNYKACQMLNREVRAGTSGNSTNRAINAGVGAVSTAVVKKKGNVGDAIAGALGGVLVGIAGDQASRAINEPRVENLEADCNQEKYYNEWKKEAAAEQKQFTRDFNTWNRSVTTCVTRESRANPGSNLQQVRKNCEVAAGPAPVRP